MGASSCMFSATTCPLCSQAIASECIFPFSTSHGASGTQAPAASIYGGWDGGMGRGNVDNHPCMQKTSEPLAPPHS